MRRFLISMILAVSAVGLTVVTAFADHHGCVAAYQLERRRAQVKVAERNE